MANWNICEDPYPGPDYPLPALRTVMANKMFMCDDEGNVLWEWDASPPVTLTTGDTLTFTYEQILSTDN